MSSIFGYTGTKGDSAAMQKALRHWSPDREAVYQNEHITIGALELFNVPEAPITPQPFEYKNYVIAADCRIDNRSELAVEFGITDISKHADIEYIAFAFEKWGADCVQHLIGDFVFTIWDKNIQKLFAARDHFGIKTLYYTIIDNELVFASEIKGIMAYPGYKLEYDERHIVSEFSFLEVPNELTMYKGVFHIPAGHYMWFDSQHQLSLKKYWVFGERKITIPPTIAEQEAEFVRLCYQSVSDRLRTYNKVGAEVSGGLDSSGIVAMAMELLGKNSEFYSFTYGKPKHQVPSQKAIDDTDTVRKICSKYGIEPYWTVVNEMDLSGQEYFELMTNVMDEYENNGVPLFSSSFLKQATEKKVGVVLSGWGGDQIVTNTWGASGLISHLATEKKYGQLWKQIRYNRPLHRAVLSFARAVVQPQANKNVLNKWVTENADNTILTDALIEKYKLKEAMNGDLTRRLAKDIHTYQIQSITARSIYQRTYQHEQVGKHFRVEYRFPMQDVRLTEYINNLPYETIAPNGKRRYLFKMAVKGLVPDNIISSHKPPIATAPFGQAFKHQNHDFFAVQIKNAIPNMNTHFFDTKKIVIAPDYIKPKSGWKNFIQLYFFAKKVSRE